MVSAALIALLAIIFIGGAIDISFMEKDMKKHKIA